MAFMPQSVTEAMPSLSKPLSLNGLRLSFSKSAMLRPRRNPPGSAQVEWPLIAMR